MGRKHANDDGGSLDLLLDTITNALGGILFLAILLVLLTKASRAMTGQADSVASGDVELLRQELASARQRLDNLQEQADTAAALARSVISPDAKEELQSLSQSRVQFDQLVAQRSQITRQIESARAARGSGGEAAQAQSASFEEATQQLEELKSQVEAEQNKRRVALPLPQERTPSTSPVNITVRYGRIYFNRGKRPADPNDANLDDFIDLGGDGGLLGDTYRQITPKPWAGIPILEGDEVSRQARSALQAWPADNYYTTIAIWDDSFAAMQKLREFLVSRGYRYRLIPLTDGESVFEGASVNARVQ